MSQDEDPAITEFAELTPFEKSLAALAPQPPELDRETLFYRAGEAAAMRALAEKRPPPPYPWLDEDLLKTATGTTTNSGFDRSTAQAVVEPVPVFIRRPYSSRSARCTRRYGWPAAFAAMTAVAFVQLALLCHRAIPAANQPAAGVPQIAAAPYVPPDHVPPSDNRLAAMIEYERLRDEIVRNGAFASFSESSPQSEPAASVAQPLSPDDLLKQILSGE